MSDNRDRINISSDSSDSESNNPPFAPYLPPYRPPRCGRRTKEQARKFQHDINAKYLPYHRDYQAPNPSHPPQASQPTHPPQGPHMTSSLAQEIPKALVKALRKHLEFLQAEPSQPEAPVPPPKTQAEAPVPPSPQPSASVPPSHTQSSKAEGPSESHGVVIGLVCPRVWDMATQSMGRNRTMPDSQSLRDALANVAQEQEKRDSKAKGKRPM